VVLHTPIPSIGDSSMPRNSASYPSSRPSTSGRKQRKRCWAPPCACGRTDPALSESPVDKIIAGERGWGTHPKHQFVFVGYNVAVRQLCKGKTRRRRHRLGFAVALNGPALRLSFSLSPTWVGQWQLHHPARAGCRLGQWRLEGVTRRVGFRRCPVACAHHRALLALVSHQPAWRRVHCESVKSHPGQTQLTQLTQLPQLTQPPRGRARPFCRRIKMQRCNLAAALALQQEVAAFQTLTLVESNRATPTPQHTYRRVRRARATASEHVPVGESAARIAFARSASPSFDALTLLARQQVLAGRWALPHPGEKRLSACCTILRVARRTPTRTDKRYVARDPAGTPQCCTGPLRGYHAGRTGRDRRHSRCCGAALHCSQSPVRWPQSLAAAVDTHRARRGKVRALVNVPTRMHAAVWGSNVQKHARVLFLQKRGRHQSCRMKTLRLVPLLLPPTFNPSFCSSPVLTSRNPRTRVFCLAHCTGRRPLSSNKHLTRPRYVTSHLRPADVVRSRFGLRKPRGGSGDRCSFGLWSRSANTHPPPPPMSWVSRVHLTRCL
jgi:hypothetical protein